MVSVLTLNFDSSIQSFGERSILEKYRDTGDMPTKSMVIGLILNALGHDNTLEDTESRTMPEVWTNKLRFAARQVYSRWTHRHTDLVIARRWKVVNNGIIKQDLYNDMIHKEYIIDGKFRVYLEGEDEDIETVSQALLFPARQLYLGRKCCIPQEYLCWEGNKPAITYNARIEEVMFKGVDLTKPFPKHIIEGWDVPKGILDNALGANMWKPSLFVKKKTSPLRFGKQLWGDMLCYSLTYMRFNDLEEIND